MNTGLPEPQPGYRWELQVPDTGRRERHPGRWIIAVVVLLVLLGIAAVAGEWLAREVTTNTIRNAVSSQLGVADSEDIEVEVPGVILLQLAQGRLDEVTLTAGDATFDQVSGDVRVHATDVATRGEQTMGSAEATIELDTAQLRSLLSTVEGFPADSATIEAPGVRMTYTLQALGVEMPVGAVLAPSAADGHLVLSPSAFVLGDAEITADNLRGRFGALADALLEDWSVCIADQLPAGVTLTAVDVTGTALVAHADIDGRIGVDPQLRAKGTCE
ncbi:MAG: DUF2993 domain-containing protein [Microbacterium sp.]|uniref:LmeA family phospholipid-binding protein n=1 Tax=Microbacterium sp. TaxID=51671 RepID=UPI003A8B27D7